MADRGFSDDDLRIYELLQQLLALSDDTDVAGRVVFLGPTGAIIGDATLSAGDFEAATDALLKLNVQRADAENMPAAPLPIDEGDITDMVNALEDLANGSL